MRPKALEAILTGGVIAGTLDLAAACVISWLRAGVGPVRVMQSIASGLLGAASYSGGAGTAALGVAPPPLSGRIIGLLVIMFCVGLPIAATVRRFSSRHRGSAS